MRGFITLHDGDTSKKYYPEGAPLLVRASAIDVIRPYRDEKRIMTTVTVHGSYLHVTETEAEIRGLMLRAGEG